MNSEQWTVNSEQQRLISKVFRTLLQYVDWMKIFCSFFPNYIGNRKIANERLLTMMVMVIRRIVESTIWNPMNIEHRSECVIEPQQPHCSTICIEIKHYQKMYYMKDNWQGASSIYMLTMCHVFHIYVGFVCCERHMNGIRISRFGLLWILSWIYIKLTSYYIYSVTHNT